MPRARRFGNLGLTLLTKAASGFWHISDPTNGYTAVHKSALQLINLDRLSKRYFFETSILIHLNIIRAVAVDVPIPARYGSEQSSLNIWRALVEFPPQLLRGLWQRIIWRYFIYDISAVTILIMAGVIVSVFGVAFGAYHWVVGALNGQFQSSGAIGISMLLIIVGFQMLLQAIVLDVMDKPLFPLANTAVGWKIEEELVKMPADHAPLPMGCFAIHRLPDEASVSRSPERCHRIGDWRTEFAPIGAFAAH